MAVDCDSPASGWLSPTVRLGHTEQKAARHSQMKVITSHKRREVIYNLSTLPDGIRREYTSRWDWIHGTKPCYKANRIKLTNQQLFKVAQTGMEEDQENGGTDLE